MGTEYKILAESFSSHIKSVSSTNRSCSFAKGLHLLQCGQGKVESALSIYSYLTQDPTIDSCILVGMGGALTPELELGSVIIGDHIFEHDYKSHQKERPPAFATAISLSDLFFKKMSEGTLKLYRGGIACGDEDLLTADRREQVRAATQALAVGWEGAGLARACLRLKKPFLEIRVISDGFNDTKFEKISAKNDFCHFSASFYKTLSNV